VVQRHVQASIDPVLTQVIGQYALAAAEEMGIVLTRTAYSTNIKERMDCSAAVFDADGRTIAQASHVPLHLGSLMGLVEQVLAQYAPEELEAGDLFIANDPFAGIGSQLNDICIVSPVFDAGSLVAFVANIAHHSDVGGRFPGSEAAASESIYQEGLRLPVVRLGRGGAPSQDVIRILQANSRVPRNVLGDLQAQVAANASGVRRIEELVERYGSAVVRQHFEAWLESAEARIRSAVLALPDGVYRFADRIDDDRDGTAPGPGGRHEELWLRVAIEVRGSSLRFDFAGCPPQLPNSHNVVEMALLATVYYATKAILDPGIPPNAGYYRAIEVVAPRGSLVNATAPAAVATRNHTCQKLVDVIMGAFAQAVPELVVAGSASSKLMIIGGTDPRTGAPFIDYEASAGGLGARHGKDGLDVCRAHMTNTANLPIEALEQEDPLLVERYELVADTGGPGRFRGGLGARRDTRMLGPGFEHSGFATGHQFPGVGLDGGARGRITAPSMLVRRSADGAEEPLDPKGHHRLLEGDVLCVYTPGGGGYGDPFTRDPAAVARDVLEDRVSVQAAAADYGVVVLADGRVDTEATLALRRRGRSDAGRI
jgi:N-methylhydantoinase B